MTEWDELEQGDLMPCPRCGNPAPLHSSGWEGGRGQFYSVHCLDLDCMMRRSDGALVQSRFMSWLPDPP